MNEGEVFKVMIVVSQDRMSVCNTFDFTVSFADASGKYRIVNKLDGQVYGSYKMSTCKKIIHDIFQACAGYSDASYRFPEYDD